MNHPISNRSFSPFSICIAAVFLGFLPAHADQPSEKELVIPEAWEYTAPLVSPEIRETEPSRAQKDPTIVFHDGRWHLFMTVKLPTRSAIEYCSFKDWDDADASPRTLLEVSDSALE